MAPELAAGSLFDAPPLLDVASAFEPDVALGLTDTLMGVGCVLKTGILQSSKVRVSGMRNPFPMHTSRSSSPPSQSGRSKTNQAMIVVEG